MLVKSNKLLLIIKKLSIKREDREREELKTKGVFKNPFVFPYMATITRNVKVKAQKTN
jgi:hypothetical protein